MFSPSGKNWTWTPPVQLPIKPGQAAGYFSQAAPTPAPQLAAQLNITVACLFLANLDRVNLRDLNIQQVWRGVDGCGRVWVDGCRDRF